MKQTIDITHWNRREHFEFFSQFDDPFFGITTLVDFTKAYEHIKAHRRPFFLSSVHFLLKRKPSGSEQKTGSSYSTIPYMYLPPSDEKTVLSDSAFSNIIPTSTFLSGMRKKK